MEDYSTDILPMDRMGRLKGRIAPVAETARFQPQIDRVQNRGTFLWTVISEYIGE